MLVLLLASVVVAITNADPVSDQLMSFKNRTLGPIGIMTTSNGAPVDVMDTDTLNANLINNDFFMETMSHFVMERVPERVVHPKGAGAFGYFEVTHNTTDFCKAKLFSEDGKRTPIAVRFSLASVDKGDPDMSRDTKGFAVKFFTEEGNFDLVTFSTPMFFTKDPITFPSVVRSVKRNPLTNLKDPKASLDLLASRPETMFIFMYLFSDYGLPDGYTHMSGFSIHTYQVYNDFGDSYFVRFHFNPEQGFKYMHADKGAKLGAKDADYGARGLYNAIGSGNFPSWKVSVQILSTEDVRRCKFDPFDMTKVLPLSDYPLRPVGRFVLDSNPTNFFADIEQLAFGPGNLVPGILGAPDKVFEARKFVYRDAQLHRLGANFNKISVNCPFANVFSYDRDGSAPVILNGGAEPNYFPNSYHGPVPYVDNIRPSLLHVEHDRSNSFDQAAYFYTNDLTKGERRRMIENIVNFLKLADTFVQKKIVRWFKMIHPDLSQRVAKSLACGNKTRECN